MAQGVLHKRSSVLDKKPTAEQLEVGEISVNYAEGDGSSFLAIKKSDDTIATFHEDDYFVNIIEDNKKVIARSLNDLNDRLSSVENSSYLEPRVETLENTVGDISSILEDVLYNA